MPRKVLTIIATIIAFSLAAPGFAAPPSPPMPTASPMGRAGAGEQAVDTAKASGEERGNAKGEQQGRTTHQNKHRGADKHQDKHRGEAQPKS